MNDKTLGYTILVVTTLIMIGYFIWSFAPSLGASLNWLTPYTEWAYRLPILAGVYIILLIILWIGYTMATTPPPIPLDNPLELEREVDQKEQEEEKGND